MKISYQVVALSVVSTLAGQSMAQVVFKEPVLRPQAQAEMDQMTKDNYALFSLPKFIDNDELVRQEQEERRQTEESTGFRSGFFQFGKAFPVDLDLTDGAWTSLQNGLSVWRLAIESNSAKSLNFIFSDFELPFNSELYLVSYNSAGIESTVGPFTADNNKGHRKFSTIPVKTSKIILELYVAGLEIPSLVLSHIVHGYKDTIDVTGTSGSCNVNVACKEGSEWANQIRGTVMMMSGNGQGYCSGSMINNLNKDGRQLFLTAKHCTGRDVSHDAVLFNYEAKSCESRTAPAPSQSAQGLKKLASFESSDFALFEVEESIPSSYNVFLNGWSAELDGYVPFKPVCVHHPSADIKKITFTFEKVSGTCWMGGCGSGKEDHWKIPKWSLGTTEPGSSGSPLFDSETKRIVGQLHGGSASCYNTGGYDVYGKMQVSFDTGSSGQRLMDFLDPGKTGQRFQDGIDLNKISELLLQ